MTVGILDRPAGWGARAARCAANCRTERTLRAGEARVRHQYYDHLFCNSKQDIIYVNSVPFVICFYVIRKQYVFYTFIEFILSKSQKRYY